MSPADIEKMVNILNERLIGVPLYGSSDKLEKEALAVLKQHVNTADTVIRSLLSGDTGQTEGKVYYGGKTNMFNQPEFHDLNKVRMLMDLMDKESQVQTLNSKTETGIQIRIGSENNHLAMENCSVITASFSVGEERGQSQLSAQLEWIINVLWHYGFNAQRFIQALSQRNSDL